MNDMHYTGNEKEFEWLIIEIDGINLNATDHKGNTALILAAERGDN